MKCKHGKEVGLKLAHDLCDKCREERVTAQQYRQQAVLRAFRDFIEHGSRFQLATAIHELYEYAYKEWAKKVANGKE